MHQRLRNTIHAALLIGALLCSASTVSVASTVFKCTATDGAVSFQDFPCAAAARTETVDLPTPPPVIDRPAPAAAGDQPEPVLEGVAETPTVAPAPPDAWLCVREDGSRYLSDNGIPQRRAVPLAMLGAPQDGLADVYSRGGAGISAPGVRAPVTRSPSSGTLGAAYVWVEDTCRFAGPGQVCAYLSDEIENTESRLRYAFSDTAAQVKQELADLRTRAATCR